MGIKYSIMDERRANIYSDMQITKLVEALAKENCIVYNIKEQDESMESFYMNLVGGEHHA